MPRWTLSVVTAFLLSAIGASAQDQVLEAKASFIFNGERIKISRDTATTAQLVSLFAAPDLMSTVLPMQKMPMPELQAAALKGLEAATEMSRRAFAAYSATTQDIAGSRVYVVEPGDSLAYISLQFYGRPNVYPRISEANREELRFPDLIQVGQRLIIPL